MNAQCVENKGSEGEDLQFGSVKVVGLFSQAGLMNCQLMLGGPLENFLNKVEL